jgi:tetratricopeptide (TPR) repeat protein
MSWWYRHCFRIGTILLLCLGLVGCYVSDKPLISADQATPPPFAALTYKEKANTVTLVRKGGGLVEVLATAPDDSDGAASPPFEAVMLLLRVADDYFAFQFPDPKSPQVSYGGLHIDTSANKLELLAFGGVPQDNMPSGLRTCGDNVCVDNLAAYIKTLKDAINSKQKPDLTFDILSIVPNDVTLTDAVAAYRNNDLATALTEFRFLAASGNPEAQTMLGIMYYSGKGVPQDDQAAFSWYQLAAKKGNPQAENNLGVMYEKGRGVPQDYGLAAKWYGMAAAQGQAMGKANLADLQQKHLQPDASSSGGAVAATQVTADDWTVCAQNGDADTSIKACSSIIDSSAETGENHAYALGSRGNAYLKKGDADHAIADFDNAIELKPDYAYGFNSRGYAYETKGDHARAIADYDKAIQLKPDMVAAYVNRGAAYMAKGSSDAAIADFNRAIELNPDFAESYYGRGQAYLNKLDYDQAIADLDKVVQRKPDFAFAYITRGNALGAKGDYDRAIADFTKAIELKPTKEASAGAYDNRGLAHSNKGELDEAIADYGRAIEVSPGFAEAYNNRGIVYETKHEYGQAIADYSSAIGAKRDFAIAYFDRGTAYEGNEDFASALDDYRTALSLALPEPWRSRAISRMDDIHGKLAAAPKQITPAVAVTPPIATSFGHRVALVIGNANYVGRLALRNPSNDANDVAAALTRVGFKVLLRTDLIKPALDQAFADFAHEAVDADAAVFYYSGHAMELGGRNFLMPVDVQKLADEEEVPYKMARVEDALQDIRRAKGVKIFVLDACRDNPLAADLKLRSRSGGLTRGLARIANADGILVAYATQAGEVAADGEGRNSPFTSAFLANVEKPGVEVVQLFRTVANDVSKTTGGSQVPEISISGSLPEFYMRPQ